MKSSRNNSQGIKVVYQVNNVDNHSYQINFSMDKIERLSNSRTQIRSRLDTVFAGLSHSFSTGRFWATKNCYHTRKHRQITRYCFARTENKVARYSEGCKDPV